MRDTSPVEEMYRVLPGDVDGIVKRIREAMDDLEREAWTERQDPIAMAARLQDIARSWTDSFHDYKQLGRLIQIASGDLMLRASNPRASNIETPSHSAIHSSNRAAPASEPWDTVDGSVECDRCGKENERGSTCSTCRLGASVHLRDRSSPQLQEAAEAARSTARTEEEDSADESEEGAPDGSGDESQEGAADGFPSIPLADATREAKKAASTAAKLASKAEECAAEAKEIADQAKEVSDDRDLPAERRSLILQEAYNRADEKVDEARSYWKEADKATDASNRCLASSEALEAAVERAAEAVEKAYAALEDAGEHRDCIVTMRDAGKQGEDQLGAEDSSSEMAAELEREMEADMEADTPEGLKRSRPCFESEAVVVGGILDYNAKLRRVDSEQPRSPVSTGSAAEPSVAAPDETISEAGEDAAEEPTVAPPGASTIDSDAA